MRVVYFSAGDVGAGHLVRGVAIERAFARAGRADVSFRIVYAGLPFAAPAGVVVDALPFERDALADPRSAPESALARHLRALDPDVLLVDLFWAPLRYVLPALRAEAWLLLRDCPAAWLGGAFHAAFDPRQYARILGIEPAVSVPVRETIDPIVVATPDECYPSHALRVRLGMAEGARLTVVAHAGAPGEIDALVPAEGTVVRAAFDGALPFPLAPWLAGADVIVGAAGYNLFWETRMLGLAARARLRPLPRTIDDQARRLRLFMEHAPRANGADTLARALR